jgi:hypothetical protein
VTATDDRVEFVVRHPNHQVIAHNAAAHATTAEECEATKHLAVGDVVASSERLADASRSSYAMLSFPY